MASAFSAGHYMYNYVLHRKWPRISAFHFCFQSP